ncbi:hypothetical protein F5X99DRAFT_411964 [Biscogniauxia marginata]|nr:hypothetical protein F5X99DRAFT_411964 [Biscogniauxia marginata]
MEADQGPRQSEAQRQAEGKEAKRKRKQEQRKARIEARREKRHAKAEAKRLRKQNSTGTARTLGRDKTKFSDKNNKKLTHTRMRAEKLEAQAKKLLAKAQQARARADYLDSLKAKENEVKAKLSHETRQVAAADLESEDFIPLDGPTVAPNGDAATSGEKDAKEKKRKDEKLQDSAIDQIMEEELGPSITASGHHTQDDEKEKKRKRKEEKKAEKRKRKAEEDGSHEAPDGAAVDVGAVDEAGTPKRKKKKSKPEATADESAANEVASEVETPKEKKKKDKKDKKKEKAPGSAKGHDEPATTTTTDGAEQWNVSALEGSDKRKDKFLRLLGAKKSNGAVAGGHAAPTTSKADIVKVESDLERQFNTGMKMKNEGQGHRRGLGA